MPAKPLHEVVEAGWARALEPVAPVAGAQGVPETTPPSSQ